MSISVIHLTVWIYQTGFEAQEEAHTAHSNLYGLQLRSSKEFTSNKSATDDDVSPVVDYLYSAVLFNPEFAQDHVVYTAERVGPCVGFFVPVGGGGAKWEVHEKEWLR